MKFKDFLMEEIDPSGFDKNKLKNQVTKSINEHGFKFIACYVSDTSSDTVEGNVIYKLLNYNESYKENSGDKSELKYVYSGSYKYNISSNKVVEFKESTSRYKNETELDDLMKQANNVKI